MRDAWFNVNGEHKVGSGAMARTLLTEADMCRELGDISERKFKELRAAGFIPDPLQLGPRCPRWTHDDLAEVIARLPRRERAPEPPTLAEGRRERIEKMKAGSASSASAAP